MSSISCALNARNHSTDIGITRRRAWRIVNNTTTSCSATSAMCATKLSPVMMALPRKFVTLRELLDESDIDPDDNAILDRLKILAQEIMPEGWIEWKVLERSREEIFGTHIDPQILNKLRFCLPTVEVARAFDPETTHLSEKTHRDIKLKMLNWAFTRALIISPPAIANKIKGSAAATEVFNEAISTLKPQLISRKEVEKILESESEESSVCRKRRGSSVCSNSSKKLKLEVLEERMNDMFGTLMTQIKALRSSRRPRLESSEDENEIENEVEEDMVDNNQENYLSSPSPSLIHNWNAPGIGLPGDESTEEDFSFLPDVKEAEPIKPEPTSQIRAEGIACQRFGADGWNRIRYKEVEKKLHASPVFSTLKLNPELVGANSYPSHFLAKQDGVLGTISHALLCQRKALADDLKNIVKEFPETSERIKKLVKDSNFQSISDNLLQFVCGHRADVIDMRRKSFKARNDVLKARLDQIPPSPTHIFDEQKLSCLVREHGGSSRVFYPQSLAAKSKHTFRKQERRVTSPRSNAASAQPPRPRFSTGRPHPSQPSKRPVMQVFTALNKAWCVHHFACSVCDAALSTRSKFYEYDERPACRRCYERFPAELRRRLRRAHHYTVRRA